MWSQLLPVNERLEPRGEEFPFSLFAAEDTGAGGEPALVPVEESSGVPDFYLLRVENPDPDARSATTASSSATRWATSWISSRRTVRTWRSIRTRSATAPRRSRWATSTGMASPSSSPWSAIRSGPDAVTRAHAGRDPQRGGLLTKLLLPAPLLARRGFRCPRRGQHTRRLERRRVWRPGGGHLARGRPGRGAQPLADEGVYLVFGRESWPAEIDLLEDADVVINTFGAGLPLSVASAGNVDGDRFDDLLVSIGGDQPHVELFRGREIWVEPIDLLGSWSRCRPRRVG